MTSERMRRRLDAFLDEADVAASANEWALVADKARAALAIEAENADALTFLRMAEANLGTPAPTSTSAPEASTAAPTSPPQPESFAAGRYHVVRFLGEGGKKRVFLAHDQLLDRDVAFALIKTDGLDDVGRERITREAQAMGRLGAHPNLVTIFDIGEEGGAPFVVTELLGGGDVEAMLADGVPPLTRTLEIAKGVARGLAFAHAQGIVHRDLKPGNVWLTSDGVAKIGDFGLAVALNRSRLTLHGLMVGTVAYMPPEQALGGEVTPQADLYSLGAMLYELVAGRPPFQGDTPTAVISQHINSTPVAPSWNSEHCPPDLEGLILKLLAKVPADRPASAAEVVAALERVDPEAKSASHSDSQANPLDRLARGVFVGRERELERLRGALDGALAGHGSLVMLVGEPGIGKTRTTQELETYARMHGAKVLWGRAHESAGAPPYWPWVQAARDFRSQVPDEERRRFYQPYAVELQRIFTGLRDLFPNLPEPPDAESDEGKFRLYDALSGFLRSVSAETPLMIVLDDLHWADGSTLAMLTHITRELGRARVLIVGTYRDTDLDRRHPLSQTLGALNREQLFARIPLRGLTEAEVGEYIAQATSLSVLPAMVRRVFEETEGNPFFLSEIVNLMTQEGTLSRTVVPDVAIPEGVREALGRRLDRLSPEANELLSLAAVLGREFAHAQLVAVSGKADDEVLRLVEEALSARVLEEAGSPSSYRFTHALMQDTLLDELSTARRVRMHGRIAQVLESLYGAGADANAVELAYHYGEAESLIGSERLVHYSLVAGHRASETYSWEAAEQHFKRGLDARQQQPFDNTAALLTLGLGQAQAAQSSSDVATTISWPNFRDAFNYFERVGDVPNAIAAADHPIPPDRPISGLAELSARSLRLVPPDSPTAARLLARHGWNVGIAEAQYEPAMEAFQKALEIADRRDLTDQKATILARMAAVAGQHDRWREGLQFAIRSRDLARSGAGGGSEGSFWGSVISQTLGETTEAERFVTEGLALAERSRSPARRVAFLGRQARLALSTGQWLNAETAIQTMPASPTALVNGAILNAHAGHFDKAEAKLAEAVSTSVAPELSVISALVVPIALCGFLGATSEVGTGYAKEAAASLVSGSPRTPRALAGARLALALIALQGNDTVGAERQYADLLPHAGTSWDNWVSCDRILGRIAQASGNMDQAAEHYEHAIVFCRRAGYRPELAWSLHDQGSLLPAHRAADRAQVVALLDEALAISHELMMAPLMEAVLAKKQILKA